MATRSPGLIPLCKNEGGIDIGKPVHLAEGIFFPFELYEGRRGA